MWKVREGQESIRTVTPEWMETGFLRGQPGLQAGQAETQVSQIKPQVL